MDVSGYSADTMEELYLFDESEKKAWAPPSSFIVATA